MFVDLFLPLPIDLCLSTCPPKCILAIYCDIFDRDLQVFGKKFLGKFEKAISLIFPIIMAKRDIDIHMVFS